MDMEVEPDFQIPHDTGNLLVPKEVEPLKK